MKRFVCLLLALALLPGCQRREDTARQSLFCMDTVMDLQVWGADAQAAAGDLAALLNDLQDQWNACDEESLIGALNQGTTQPDPQQQRLLDRVEELSRRTGGAFDPHLHSVSACWGFPTGDYRVPTREELAEALKEDDWDLGAALKGYAGDRCVELLKGYDVDRAILDLGGNIQTWGEKPDGTPWQIGIRDPRGEGLLGTVSVRGTMAVVTSGDYQRYFEADGKRYHHILDPKTGYPADSGLSAVTVICADGLTADALSTALFVLGLEAGTRLWQESGDFEAVFVLTTGEVFATEGAALSGCDYEVICRED